MQSLLKSNISSFGGEEDQALLSVDSFCLSKAYSKMASLYEVYSLDECQKIAELVRDQMTVHPQLLYFVDAPSYWNLR